MSELIFFWIALFKDNTKIEQFNEDGTEHKFKEVQEKMKDLAYFNLTNKEGKFFTVDLLKGIIGYNDLVLPYREVKEKKNNIRLIFFRRHTIHMTEAGHPIDHTIIYHLGYQWNDESGKNRQIILKIDEQGNWILGE
jgi:hypothetical protein